MKILTKERLEEIDRRGATNIGDLGELLDHARATICDGWFSKLLAENDQMRAELEISTISITTNHDPLEDLAYRIMMERWESMSVRGESADKLDLLPGQAVRVAIALLEAVSRAEKGAA